MTKPFAISSEDQNEARRQRGDSRDSMFLHAYVRPIDGGPDIQVRVRNLSAGGMMAEPEVQVAEGERVWVELRGIGEISATVVWTAVGRAGLAFEREIDPRKARKTIADPAKNPRPTVQPPTWRPGLKVQ